MAEINDFNVTDDFNTARWPESMYPATVNDSGRADEGILARWHKDTNGSLVSTGTANAYVVTTNRTLGALYDGFRVAWEAHVANTGATTVNVSTTGAKALRKHHDQALVSGDIEAGQKIDMIYDADGDIYQMLSHVANAPPASADVLLLSGGTMTGDINNADKRVIRPLIRDYGIEHTAVSSSSGAITLDYSTANSFATTLTENITAITLSNPPASGNYGEIVWHVTQHASAAKTVAGWPAAVKWADNDPYVASTTVGAKDRVFLSTNDGGTTWLGEYRKGYA